MRELIAQEARINKCGWAQRYLQYAFHTICAKFAVIDSLATIQVFDRIIAGHSIGSSVPHAYLTGLESPRRCVFGTADIIVRLGTDVA